MLSTSWKATGLVRAAWKRLDAKSGQRELLAELTGIPATNLSGLNTGRLPMTRETAQRIADAVTGLTILDLGATEEAAAENSEAMRVIDRLQALEESALRVEDLSQVLRVLELLATGKRTEALRVLTEAVEQ